MNINKVFLTGNLTRNPELRTTASGTQVLSFGIAVNDRRKNQQTGEWEDYPNFIDCTMFGARAQNVFRFLSKGNKVAVEGKLHWSQWERDGAKHSKIDVTVDQIEFMSQFNNQPSSQAYTETTPLEPVQSQMSGMPDPVTTRSIYDDDIEF